MRLCLYEDRRVEDLGPLALLRPAFALRCGVLTLAEKIAAAFPDAPIEFLVRPGLEAWTAELMPNSAAASGQTEDTLFVNGRLCLTDDEALHLMAASQQESCYQCQGEIFAAKVRGDRAARVVERLRSGSAEEAFEDLRYPAEVQAFLARSSADLIHWSHRQIVQDVKQLFEGGVIRGGVDDTARLLKRDRIHIARGSRVMAGAVLNAEAGPVVIRENATVEPMAYLEGPVSIGEGSIVRAGARIRNSAIGPVCRVGGEISESVLQGYANKQHDGFLGHSFVGEWVNLGANTNTSDLKNTYSNVRTYGSTRALLEKRGADSGRLLLGLTIGDFTKTGISTSFTSGATVGIGCNLYGTALQPAYVPSFVWGAPGEYVEHRVDAVVETASRAMERRSTALTVELDGLLRRAHAATRDDRELFLAPVGGGRR